MHHTLKEKIKLKNKLQKIKKKYYKNIKVKYEIKSKLLSVKILVQRINN